LKTTFTILTFLVAIICSAQSNLDFERWDVNYNGIDESKHWINTSDASKYGAPTTMFKEVDNPAEGLASVKLVTSYWEAGSSYELDTLVGSLLQQCDYNKRPKSFEFSYKSAPKLGDEILVGIQLTINENGSVLVVGEGFFTTNEIQQNWTKQKVEIEYFSNITPDNINIIALSSANAVINNGANGYSKIGSTLFFDNLKLNEESSIEIENEYYINVFPNPAKSFINVESNSPEKQEIEIYNLSGELLLSYSFTQHSKFDISTLPTGTYIYKVFSLTSHEITSTNKFNVIR